MKESDRIIYHCDCNGFFASVEETFHPEYKKIPMAVAGDPENRRGIILAKNEPAKKFGIKTAETVWQAKKKCPDLLLVPPRRHSYSEFCEKVNAVYEQYTDRVERFGIENYRDIVWPLPVSDLFLVGRSTAEKLQSFGITTIGMLAQSGETFLKKQ